MSAMAVLKMREKEIDRKISVLKKTTLFIVEEMPTGDYRLSRMVNKKAISIVLVVRSDGFWIRPPAYTFKSSTSFFDFCENETRWTRNKQTIVAVIKALQTSGIWNFIVNKDFFKVNENTKSSIQNKAKNELHQLKSNFIL